MELHLVNLQETPGPKTEKSSATKEAIHWRNRLECEDKLQQTAREAEEYTEFRTGEGNEANEEGR